MAMTIEQAKVELHSIGDLENSKQLSLKMYEVLKADMDAVSALAVAALQIYQEKYHSEESLLFLADLYMRWAIATYVALDLEKRLEANLPTGPDIDDLGKSGMQEIVFEQMRQAMKETLPLFNGSGLNMVGVVNGVVLGAERIMFHNERVQDTFPTVEEMSLTAQNRAILELNAEAMAALEAKVAEMDLSTLDEEAAANIEDEVWSQHVNRDAVNAKMQEIWANKAYLSRDFLRDWIGNELRHAGLKQVRN